MRRVRDVILRADYRMTESIKYGTLMFGYEGDMVTFVQVDKNAVTLMFNRGARIKGRFPHLKGTGPSARFMHFADLAEVEKRAAELSAITRAWCTLMASSGGATRTQPKTTKPTRSTGTRKAKASRKT